MIVRELIDFYLPFDSSDLIELFNGVDFTGFSEFELFISTLIFNLVFICFIGFMVYVFIKLINKVTSWLF